MSLRYKVGDRVALGDAETLKGTSIDLEYAHETAIIDEIEDNSYYRVVVEKDGEDWYIGDDDIDHEATANLNQPKLFDINKEFEKIAAGILTNNIEEMQNSNPTIKVKIGDKIICSKGGETMNANEILEKWKSKRMCEIEIEYRNEKDQLTKEDEIAKLIEKHIAQMNKTIKEKYDGVEKAVQVAVIRTPETEEKINLAEEEMSNKKLNIKKKIEEIKAVLNVAENQDKVFEILNKQGIIDKNYNIL